MTNPSVGIPARETTSPPHSPAPILRCAGLGKVINATTILDSIDLEVMPDELVILSGPSGAGKTTLLRLIAGLERPSTGVVEIGQTVVGSPDFVVPPIARGVGMVFEHAALWPHLTVERHLDLVLKPSCGNRRERRQRVDRLIERLRLSAFRDRFPHELSGGERRRVALARSLAPAPRLLLLDEPLAHIDVHLAADLARTLVDMQREYRLTMIFVMHRPEQVNDVASRYVILEEGKILQDGKASEVFSMPRSDFVRALARMLDYGARSDGGRGGKWEKGQ